MQPAVSVIGSSVTALSFDDHVSLMIDWALRRESRIVCAANVHMLVEAHRRPEFGAILEGADLVAPDGMPLVWMMRRLGAKAQERVAGMDLLPELCSRAELRGVRVFFLGSSPEVLERIRNRLQRQFPGLQIAGMVSPPFRPLSQAEDEALVRQIWQSGAGLVLVALGCPKQERWMLEHRGRIPAVMVGLGGAFPVFAGVQKMAPAWIRSAGLEWGYRLMQEPGRLWKRYGTTNLQFAWLALKQLATSSSRAQAAPGLEGLSTR